MHKKLPIMSTNPYPQGTSPYLGMYLTRVSIMCLKKGGELLIIDQITVH